MTFYELSQFFSKIEQTSSRLEITRILSELFLLSTPDEIYDICYLLQGRIAPLFTPLEFGIADKFMIRVLAKISKHSNEEVLRMYKKLGDLGSTGEQLQIQLHKKSHVSIHEVFEAFRAITQLSGLGSQERKIYYLAELFSSLDAISLRYAVRIPLGKLRLGLSDMTILDGLSWMITGDKSYRDILEEAYHVHPDIGTLAQEVKAHGINGAKRIHAAVGIPILPCLCQRLPDAEEMISKMGIVSVEPKYDGTRVQIHIQKVQSFPQNGIPSSGTKFKVQSFSRNLENTTDMFPELLDIGKQITADNVILDSEAVGIDPVTNHIVPFQLTITRKRKHGIDQLFGQVPIRFYVFDILFKDNSDLLSIPLSKRREILEKTVGKGELLVISPSIVTDNPDQIRSLHHQFRKDGLEGVIVKKWDGVYTPGRREYTWVKLKEEDGRTGKLSDTVDAVVMGYYKGEGKRTKFGIGAFLVGIRKGESFVTVTKIGTGVTDAQWRELKILFDAQKTKNKPRIYEEVPDSLVPDIWIEPSIVVEIAGDDITISPLHGALYAIRFPRLIKVRRDKSPQDCTSVEEIHIMYVNDKSNSH